MAFPWPIPERCSQCARQGTKPCGRCWNAPPYAGHDNKPTHYCSQVCYTAHSPVHSPECGKLQDRKTIARATELLYGILYRILLRAATTEIRNIETKGADVILYSFGAPRKLNQFRLPTKVDRVSFDASLMFRSSLKSMVFLPGFMRLFFQYLEPKVTEVALIPTASKLRCIEFMDGDLQPLPLRHDVFKMTFPSGEVWVFDPTSAQFGYQGFLFPWQNYLNTSVTTILSECELGAFVERECPAGTSLPPPVMRFAELLMKEIPKMTQEDYRLELAGLLLGSDQEFTRMKETYLRSVERLVQACFNQIYDDQINKWEVN